MANEKLQTLQIDDTAMDTPSGSGLKWVKDVDGDNEDSLQSVVANDVDGNRALGVMSLAQGNGTQALGDFSHSEGEETMANGNASHAEGYATDATGRFSHAEGDQAKAISDAAHAEGLFSLASGVGSHAEGYTTEATGLYSHAEGSGAKATGEAAHAHGAVTTAGGYASTATGQETYAGAPHSSAHGMGTTTRGIRQFAVGQYNLINGNPSEVLTTRRDKIFIVGNGTSDSRSNAFSVAWDGSVYGIPQTATTNFFTVNTTNFELTTQQAVWWGPVMQINLVVKNKSAISVPATGNISNLQVGTLATGYRPVWTTAAYSFGDNAGQAWYTISASGIIQLGAVEGTGAARTIAASQTFNVCATFIRTMGADS